MKSVLRSILEQTGRIRDNEGNIERLNHNMNTLRDQLTAFVAESCEGTLTKSLEEAERRIRPLQDLQEKEMKYLNEKLDGLFTTLGAVRK
jgi:predicted RNase H-like nuclease (RuvC/YqgF family)